MLVAHLKDERKLASIREMGSRMDEHESHPGARFGMSLIRVTNVQDNDN